MNHKTGLAPDRLETRNRERRDCNFRDAAFGYSSDADAIVQPVPFLRDQRSFPSCVGQSLAACIDAARGGKPWASAVSIWREARRRQDEIENILDGTRFEYAIAGLVERGWDPFVDGEDSDEAEAGLGAPDAGDDLADELFAHDKRARGLARYRIDETGSDLLDAVDAALANRLGVVFGTGVREPYFSYAGHEGGKDLVLGTGYLGGDDNGHAQRVFAMQVVNGTRIYYVQNSWGWWGGCHSPAGVWLPGCCKVSGQVLIEAWDVFAIQAQV